MKIRFWGVLFLLAAPLLARAEETTAVPAPIIGIVDIDEIQRESQASKAMLVQLNKYRQEFQQEYMAEDKALRTTKQEIEQQSKALAPDVLAEKARAFDLAVAEFQRKDQARRQALEKSFNMAMGKVQQAMYEATRKVATEHGANIILPRGQVLLFADQMNMTKEIIALMDKALPTVDFPQPVISPDAGQPVPPVQQTTPPKKKN
jgi:Skp family chaperone for outer membrane proteins